ncbi:MAG: hypothetical protein ACI39W_03525 [Brotaphodocola sp.]
MKKRTKAMLAAVIMAAVMAVPAYAGTWAQDETGYWYQNDSGSYARDQIMSIDGVNYGFNQQAYMITGWAKFDGSWYYFDPATGAQTSGWQFVDNVWYYLNPSNGNAMQTGFVKIGNNIFYLDENGAMKTGTFSADGFTYFAETSGAIRRNTLETEGSITIRYDEEGRQWYKNDENRVNNQSGGDLWLPLLDAAALQKQRAAVQENNADYIIEVKDELYEDYKDDVLSVTYSKRASKLEKWVAKVNRELSKLYLDQDEIDNYISAVKSGIYGDDDYYDDETGEYSYEYYYIDEYDDDDDWD